MKRETKNGVCRITSGHVLYLEPDKRFAIVEGTGVRMLGDDSVDFDFFSRYHRCRLEHKPLCLYDIFDVRDHFTKKAASMAEILYKGQTDLADEPFITHLKRVDALVSAAGYIDEPENTVAYLYRIFEDTSLTERQMRELGFHDTIIQAIKAIHRTSELTEMQYLTQVAQNPIAMRVKMAVLLDNMNLARIAIKQGIRKITAADVARTERYLREFQYLKAVSEQTT